MHSCQLLVAAGLLQYYNVKVNVFYYTHAVTFPLTGTTTAITTTTTATTAPM